VIQEITDNLLVIPNTQLLSSSFRNFSLPDRSLVIPIEIGIGYDSDLETVETITLEVAREVSVSPGPDTDGHFPSLLYRRFDYYGISLTVYLQVFEGKFFDHLTLKHEFIKRLHHRYRREGIPILVPGDFPYPLPRAREASVPESS
jgi:small-conductance mechanosensitive channel